MRKRIFGRKLKRNIDQRKALFKSLMRSLVLYGRIRTTRAKAKAIRPEIEKLITHAKKKGDAARYHLQKYFSEEIINRMIGDIAPKFLDRPGGYIRLINIRSRVKDNAPMVLMEWVEPIDIKNQRSNIKNKKNFERGREKKAKEGSKKGQEKAKKEVHNAKTNKTHKK